MSTTQTGLRRKRRSPGWAFVGPYVLFLFAFGLLPVGYALVQSFIVTPVYGDAFFSLWQNFADVLSDYRLPSAARNVGLFLLLWLPALLVVVFVIALVMDARKTRFVALTRFVTYMPGAVTGAAAAVLWTFMFSPTLSPVGALLVPFAANDGTFINNDSLAIVLAVMAVATGAGGWIVLLFGALTAISKDVIEAAVIDGANAWQLVWNIKLPLIRNYIAFILIVSFASGFQVFAEPAVIAAGSSGRVSPTWSINQLVYSYASGEANFGRASALALILLVICTGIAVLVITRTKFYSVGNK